MDILREIGAIVRSKRFLKDLGIVVGVFVLVNIGLYIAFLHQTYPNVSVAGKQIGGVSERELPAKLASLHLLPDTVVLTYSNKAITQHPAELGITLDTNATQKQALARHWLPIANLLAPPHVSAVLTTNTSVLQAAVAKLAETYAQAPIDARMVLENGEFRVVNAVPGGQPDKTRSAVAIQQAVADGKTTIALPRQTLAPKVDDAVMNKQLQTIQAQQKTAISYTFGGGTIKPSATDNAGWYAATNNTYVLSDALVSAYVVHVAREHSLYLKNAAQAAAATVTALKQQKAATIALETTTVGKTYTYCVKAAEVDASNLPGLEAKLRAAYADARGWNLGGLIVFTQVSSGCDYTVWLAASTIMPSFGPICDSQWSCMPGSAVVINFDRWQGASDAWNAAGGSLDDYRSMVINHESGHWLGFGHANCPGAGQPAPVMQQQSINLQGCVFNPWPTTGELATLKTRLGL
ncbi:MAG TPA: DUF3152 domain-containing protein [Candidatus Saccharimonadales bacterium]|nr:DUF3152 domain-containing protein [Candidatus Saccharimonadales bacterium]